LACAIALAAGARPAWAQQRDRALDLENPASRMVQVELAIQSLDADGRVVQMGFGPKLPASFSSDGTTARVEIAGADAMVQPPALAPVQIANLMAEFAAAELTSVGNLVAQIDVATRATRITQMAMGRTTITARLNGTVALDQQPLEFAVITQAATDLGPLFLAGLVAVNPLDGMPVVVPGGACAMAESPFLANPSFGLQDCNTQVRVGESQQDRFVDTRRVNPEPFNARRGEVHAVGTEKLSISPILGVRLPDAIGFNRTNQILRITELPEAAAVQ
jgi:hypothetical protein